MKLQLPAVFLLFALGAAAGLVGDHCHVVTGTLEYLPAGRSVPFLWSSPFWFPALVGIATVSLAELRLHLPGPRSDVTVRQGIAGAAAVVGAYVLTGVMHTAPTVPATVKISEVAEKKKKKLGDRPAVLCGVLAAVVGPLVEIVLVQLGVFRYAPRCDWLFGVGPWLVPLYFAFGVVAALLGEVGARRQSQPRPPATALSSDDRRIDAA